MCALVNLYRANYDTSADPGKCLMASNVDNCKRVKWEGSGIGRSSAELSLQSCSLLWIINGWKVCGHVKWVWLWYRITFRKSWSLWLRSYNNKSSIDAWFLSMQLPPPSHWCTTDHVQAMRILTSCFHTELTILTGITSKPDVTGAYSLIIANLWKISTHVHCWEVYM
jgi:hypothetical protein